MNNLFRNIKENNNLDALEESDDDEDFENINDDKYVNVNKHFNFECKYSYKFKKWMPLYVINNSSIVHLNEINK